jgi:hypothetical protein
MMDFPIYYRLNRILTSLTIFLPLEVPTTPTILRTCNECLNIFYGSFDYVYTFET